MMRILLLKLLLLPLLGLSLFARAEEPLPALIIVIDDLGNNRSLGQRAVDLPSPVNLAFLPYTPFVNQLANSAYAHGHSIMLHAPMESSTGKNPGEGALLTSMSKEQLHASLSDSLASIPGAQGVNNHMGSKLTSDRRSMSWVMQVLRDKGLFFIDSRTAGNSIAAQAAAMNGMATLERDVFLDNERDHALIRKQFERGLKVSKVQGFAVMIGHPYPETLDVLGEVLADIKSAAQPEYRLMAAGEYLKERKSLLDRMPRFPAMEPRTAGN